MAVTVGNDVQLYAGDVEKIDAAGEAIGKGDAIYLATDGKAYKAYNTDTVARVAVGIAIMASDVDKPVYYVGNDGELELDESVALTEANFLYVGTTAGDLELYSELTSGDWKVQLGEINKAGRLEVRIKDEEETKT